MSPRCPECGADNARGTFSCGRCGAALLPDAMMPPPGLGVAGHAASSSQGAAVYAAAPPSYGEDPPAALPPEGSFVSEQGETRYRIILGDTCPICRAASRISFRSDRPPQMPIAGCRDPDGCHCTLPIFAADLDAALAAPEPSLAALAPARGAALSEALPAGAADGEAGLEPSPAGGRRPPEDTSPEWSLPAPITRRRHRDLGELTALYYQRRIQGIRVRTEPGCCRVCTDVAVSIYEPSVAPTLPVVGCWHGWRCRCMYAEEPLPLDEKGHAALRTLAAREREAILRQRKVARFAPRLFHEAVIACAAMLAAGALWQFLDGARPALWTVLLPLALAGVCIVLALEAMARTRPLPMPQWIDILAGLAAAGLGLRSLAQAHFPAGLSVADPDLLSGAHLTLTLSGHALLVLPRGEQMLAAAGLALLLAGLAGVIISPGYRRRAVTD